MKRYCFELSRDYGRRGDYGSMCETGETEREARGKLNRRLEADPAWASNNILAGVLVSEEEAA
jgi:hypothetical protein